MSEATLARRARELREEHSRTSPLAGAVWPSGLEERATTWGDRIFAALALAVWAVLFATIVLGLVAPEGCPLEEVVFGADDACEAYAKDEAYWNARLGVPPDNHNDKE